MNNLGTDPFDGQTFFKSYDLRDRVTTLVDANGVTTSLTYDNLSRVLTRSYPDGGVEKYQYSARGLIAYTNQLAFVTRYGYDALGRKIAETNANSEVTQYSYNPGGDLIGLTDAKNHRTQWGYDQYGRLTNVIDATGTTILRFKFDQDGRLTNRWSAAKGDTYYTLDNNGNVTLINYPSMADVSFAYDALNQVTNMVDGFGTTTFTYTSFGALSTEAEFWSNASLTYSHQANHLRSGLSLVQPNASPWTVTYGYDTANRLQNVTATPGTFTYNYQGGSLVKKLALPNGAYITNTFDNVARTTATTLENSVNSVLNSHSYVYNTGNQRTRQTRTSGEYVDYTYDAIGQLKTAVAKESGGVTNRWHESFGYAYDAANNLHYRTNNALVQTFGVDTLNQLSTVARSGTLTVAGTAAGTATNVTSVTVADNGNSPVAATVYGDKTFARAGVTVLNGPNTFTAVAQDAYGRSDTNSVTLNLPSSVNYFYDANGNLISDGTRTFNYDDENRLNEVYVANTWWTEFYYDGRNRLRVRQEYLYQNASWVLASETRYVYDGSLVIQELDINNIPTVTYTRGWDMSGTCCDAAGGIGGLLARTDNSLVIGQTGDPHAYYHADANGNVTMLINSRQLPVAKYLYDPYGNTLSKVGPLADANTYRFSSKEFHDKSGLYSFGRRFYDPNLQRWLNRDPSGMKDGPNLYAYVKNGCITSVDAWGSNTITFDEQAVTQAQLLNMAALTPNGLTRGFVEAHLGVTHYIVKTEPHAVPDFKSGRCRVVLDSTFTATIETRYLAPDTYTWLLDRPPNDKVLASTPSGGTYPLTWRGIVLDATSIADILQHEHEHRMLYYNFLEETEGWYERELLDFNRTPAGRRLYHDENECAAAVQTYGSSGKCVPNFMKFTEPRSKKAGSNNASSWPLMIQVRYQAIRFERLSQRESSNSK